MGQQPALETGRFGVQRPAFEKRRFGVRRSFWTEAVRFRNMMLWTAGQDAAFMTAPFSLLFPDNRLTKQDYLYKILFQLL